MCVCMCVCVCSCPHVGVSMTTNRASTVWDTSCESRSPCPPDSAGAPVCKCEPSSVLGPPRAYQTDPERFEDQVGGGDKAKDVECPSPTDPQSIYHIFYLGLQLGTVLCPFLQASSQCLSGPTVHCHLSFLVALHWVSCNWVSVPHLFIPSMNIC